MEVGEESLQDCSNPPSERRPLRLRRSGRRRQSHESDRSADRPRRRPAHHQGARSRRSRVAAEASRTAAYRSPERLVSSFRVSDLTNLFVSHLHEDDAQIENLRGLLSDRGMDIRDSSSSIPRGQTRRKISEYIKHQILAPRIDWAGTLVVLISPETKDSEYVKWEIDYAEKTETRIVGVFTRGSAGTDMPEGLEDYADAIVNGMGTRSCDAIREKTISADRTARRVSRKTSDATAAKTLRSFQLHSRA